MKRTFALLMAFILVFSLVSCKLAEKEEAEPTAILTEEPTPEPSPTVLYICNGHEWRTDEYLSDVGDMDITDTFKYYVNSPEYADYAFCFEMSLIIPRNADASACTVEEVERLTQLGYNVWIINEEKTIVRGIATQKQLQEFPYDRSSYGYRMSLSTNEPYQEAASPESSPAILYICDNHGSYNDGIMKIGWIKKGNKFREYMKDPAYADYSFCFIVSVRASSFKIKDVKIYTEQEAERLTQLGYNVWLTGEDKTIIQGIASQKQLQDFPYDLESFGYRIRLSTNEPNAEPPDEWKTIVVQLQS